MIKLVLTSCLFVSLGFLVTNALSMLILASDTLSSIMEVRATGPDVYAALSDSKLPTDAARLIIGDSAAKQLFSVVNERKERVRNLTSTQATSMVGQYIIALNALKNNTTIKEVYLFYHPISFLNDLDQPSTFNQFIRPFYVKEYSDLFSPLVYGKLKKRIYYYLFGLPLSKVLPVFTVIDYSTAKNNFAGGLASKLSQRPFLSEISIEYLKKLDAVCLANNIRFKVFMPPISTIANRDFSLMKAAIKSNNMEHIFSGYFENMLILDNSFFKEGLHYKSNYIHDIFATLRLSQIAKEQQLYTAIEQPRIEGKNLIENGEFEKWSKGRNFKSPGNAQITADGWATNRDGDAVFTISREDTPEDSNAERYGAKIDISESRGARVLDFYYPLKGADKYPKKIILFSAKIRASKPGVCQLLINDDDGIAMSSFNQGTDWETLTCIKTVGSGTLTFLNAAIRVKADHAPIIYIKKCKATVRSSILF